MEVDFVVRDKDGENLHRALRSGERDASERVPEGAQHGRGFEGNCSKATMRYPAAAEVDRGTR